MTSDRLVCSTALVAATKRTALILETLTVAALEALAAPLLARRGSWARSCEVGHGAANKTGHVAGTSWCCHGRIAIELSIETRRFAIHVGVSLLSTIGTIRNATRFHDRAGAVQMTSLATNKAPHIVEIFGFVISIAAIAIDAEATLRTEVRARTTAKTKQLLQTLLVTSLNKTRMWRN